jgi:hypothetical protein
MNASRRRLLEALMAIWIVVMTAVYLKQFSEPALKYVARLAGSR